MRSRQAESISDVILVLGKRLQSNQLTLEGRSRVEALPDYLQQFLLTKTALIFCGGVTQGQSVSEAALMHEYYQQLRGQEQPEPALTLLEDKSQTTVENIQNAARNIVDIATHQSEKSLKVHLVSNDYHLERIFQIQKLLNEQGLLGVLIGTCQKAGIELNISDELSDHACTSYPYNNKAGEVFLSVDELTVYRVYLEGLARKAFTDVKGVRRQQPYRIAKSAIAKLNDLVKEHEYLQKIKVLENLVETVDGQCGSDELMMAVGRFNKELTSLNRLVDPERANSY